MGYICKLLAALIIYYCRFRPGRSVSDQIFPIKQIFIAFKQVYDRTKKPKVWEVMRAFAIPTKLGRLVTKCKVILDNEISQSFTVNRV